MYSGVLLVLALCALVHGNNVYYNTSSSCTVGDQCNFLDPNIWNGAVAPVAGDQVYIWSAIPVWINAPGYAPYNFASLSLDNVNLNISNTTFTVSSSFNVSQSAIVVVGIYGSLATGSLSFDAASNVSITGVSMLVPPYNQTIGSLSGAGTLSISSSNVRVQGTGGAYFGGQIVFGGNTQVYLENMWLNTDRVSFESGDANEPANIAITANNLGLLAPTVAYFPGHIYNNANSNLVLLGAFNFSGGLSNVGGTVNLTAVNNQSTGILDCGDSIIICAYNTSVNGPFQTASFYVTNSNISTPGHILVEGGSRLETQGTGIVALNAETVYNTQGVISVDAGTGLYINGQYSQSANSQLRVPNLVITVNNNSTNNNTAVPRVWVTQNASLAGALWYSISDSPSVVSEYLVMNVFGSRIGSFDTKASAISGKHNDLVLDYSQEHYVYLKYTPKSGELGGLMWYWWLLIVLAVVALIAIIAFVIIRRRRQASYVVIRDRGLAGQ